MVSPSEQRLRVGVDLVDVERLRRLLEEHANSHERLFTTTELEYCQGKRRRYEHLAARFAAKEAVLKAFGTGVSQRMRFTEVEVLNERSGRPRVRLLGSVASFAENHGLSQLDVSLSHTESTALAHVVSMWRSPVTSEPSAV
ncbi:MAG TPA: holo-ACP synthase [Solirubrobacteraceae bacterium]|jgi:holo-[acyl-carrier protein] synthase